MQNAILFVATVVIWGTTWLGIAMQVGPVPVLTSIFYRFVAASLIFLTLLAVSGRLKVPSRADQPFVLLQALCLFCCNFICFYYATSYVPSGLVSVIFSLATVYNAVNARLIFGDRITGRTLVAGLLGVAGLALLFGRDIVVEINLDTAKGIALAALGTLSFSLGNMVSRRNSAAGLSPVTANAWGMTYGAVILLALVLVTGTPLVAPPDVRYVGALIYLAVFGSVVGFTTYLLLVARIGSSRAAYMTVLFPLIALTLSSLFEHYQWTLVSVVGLALTLIGNLVMFGKPRATRPPASATG